MPPPDPLKPSPFAIGFVFIAVLALLIALKIFRAL